MTNSFKTEWTLPWLEGGPEGVWPFVDGDPWPVAAAIGAGLLIGIALYLNNRRR